MYYLFIRIFVSLYDIENSKFSVSLKSILLPFDELS